MSAAVGLGVVLIAEAAGPGDERADGCAVASYLNVGVKDVGLVEGEGLADVSCAVRVIEGERCRRGESASGRRDVESFAEAAVRAVS